MSNYQELILSQIKAQKDYVINYNFSQIDECLNLITKFEAIVKKHPCNSKRRYQFYEQILLKIDSKISSNNIKLKR